MNNFLSLVWYKVLPAEYGGQKGIAHFNQYLGQKVSLTCLCSRNNSSTDDLSYKVVNRLPVSKFQFWDPFVRQKVVSFVRSHPFSHVIAEHPWYGWLGKFKQKYGFRFIVHAHNIEHLRFRAENKTWWRFTRSTERKAFQLADLILFKTTTDRDYAIHQFGIPATKCLLVPYGTTQNKQPIRDNTIQTALRDQLGVKPGERFIFFAGSGSYQPNVEALQVLITHVIPQLKKKGLRFKLVISGKIPGKTIVDVDMTEDIIATGHVQEIEKYFQAADVFLNPVVSGSGVQTKNIEAIAHGCNVVTTEFASKGLPGYPERNKLFISPNHDWNAFADQVMIASTVVQPTPQAFYDDYNWENIIDRMLPRLS